MVRFPVAACLLLAGMTCAGILPAAEPKKPPVKEKPKVLLAMPLGIAPGSTTKVVLRGLRLDEAMEVRCQAAHASVKLLKKEKSGPPNMLDAKTVGDTRLEAEVQLPREVTGPTVSLTVMSAAGESAPHALFVERTAPVMDREPNNGFASAQEVKLPAVIQGAIDSGRDVDVYRFEGKAGQQVVFEVQAARHGSALDSLLTLYDADRHILATSDDHAGSADSLLEATLPRTGRYFLSIIDANDQDSPLHVYRLSAHVK